MSVGYVVSFAEMASETGPRVMGGFAIAGIFSGAVRVATLVHGGSAAAMPRLDIQRARVLEKRFAVAYFQFAFLLGLSAAYVFSLESARLHMLTMCLIVGYGAGAAAGVGLIPWIAIPSMAVAIVPGIVVAALRWDPVYWVAAAMTTALLAGGSQSVLRRYRVASTEIANRLTFEALARHDVLTTLPNRLALREWFDSHIAIGADQQLIAVHCLDLDKFKPVNDVFGHPVGDGLLKTIAMRLTQALRPGDIAARLGGDEFAVIQRELRHPEEAAALAERLRKAIAEPFSVQGHDISVSTCIGYALSRYEAADLDDLLGLADQALYAAKNSRSGVECDSSRLKLRGRLAA
ncbi:MAG: GGDEF domain-containing protein [Bradyrhizobium sp.]|uniref:GGDEF domain-containing protein n=1 Tax=Bradyrhizobium sp. TaxID=376 RepID=UPI0029AB4A8C|nr:GGDEF domain-containing protein [Bradyrhizobium sp.]MDX3969120.1 GGDEF domain-containing protein [Bradyrhizobium sp.]